MSRRARSRAAAVEAKHAALIPLASHDDDREDDDDAECPHCHGDGRDPDCDYLLPCPICLGGA